MLWVYYAFLVSNSFSSTKNIEEFLQVYLMKTFFVIWTIVVKNLSS